MKNMENNNKTIVVKFIIGVDGEKRQTTTDNFREQAEFFLDAFKARKDDVRDCIAVLAHEFVLYKNNRDADWKPVFNALKEAQDAVADMNRILQLDFKQFKQVWKPFQVDPAYGIVCRAIAHYWTKFYGTPDLDGIMNYVTFYSEELPKIRYVERDDID